MSSRKEAKSAKKVTAPRLLKPAASPPVAMVLSRHGSGMHSRVARGFSLGEVSAVGMSTGDARGWGLLVDERRRTVLDGNVSAIKEWSSKAQKAEPKKVAKLEKEVEKVEAEVKKEVKEVEEEVVRAEKKVRKKAGRAAKVAEKVVEKPVKARTKKAQKKAD